MGYHHRSACPWATSMANRWELMASSGFLTVSLVGMRRRPWRRCTLHRLVAVPPPHPPGPHPAHLCRAPPAHNVGSSTSSTLLCLCTAAPMCRSASCAFCHEPSAHNACALLPPCAGPHRAHLQHLRPPHGAGRRPCRVQLCVAGAALRFCIYTARLFHCAGVAGTAAVLPPTVCSPERVLVHDSWQSPGRCRQGVGIVFCFLICCW